jgi:hypothetical protein
MDHALALPSLALAGLVDGPSLAIRLPRLRPPHPLPVAGGLLHPLGPSSRTVPRRAPDRKFRKPAVVADDFHFQAALAVVFLVWWLAIRSRRSPTAATPRPPAPLEFSRLTSVCIAITAVGYGIFLLNSLTSFPTSWDGNAYHLPKALRWLQEELTPYGCRSRMASLASRKLRNTHDGHSRKPPPVDRLPRSGPTP